jgi:hypothetical protein
MTFELNKETFDVLNNAYTEAYGHGRTSMKADIHALLNKSTARSPEHQSLVKAVEGME